ncbi:MAG: enoyl-CoA hydratase/isomerase family protein [Actinobacteria bacterium]|nr:enoyl-CoA hydratase/isomerase family protein [Actinomycetota bacterium]
MTERPAGDPADDPADDGVRYEVTDRVAHVRLNRPEVHNAQSLPLLRALDAALMRAAEDRGVKVIVLSGVGESFSSGHDLGTDEQAAALASFGVGRTHVEANFEYSFHHFLEMSLRWRDIPKPTIAQVHGWCLFGGWMLASPMDLIVAADDTRFMTGFLQFFSLPYDIGVRKAKELMFAPREIGAAEAHELGFVTKVVPRAELESATDAFAHRIAKMPLFQLRLAKLAANGIQDAAGFRTAMTSANAHQMLTYLDELARERRKTAGQGGTADGPAVRERRRPIVDRILTDDDRR